MTTLRRLLVATDLSGSSLHAVDRGFQIAQDTGAACTIMHALGLDAMDRLREMVGERAADVSQALLARRRAALETIASDPSRSRGVAAALHVDEGLPARAVPAHADAIDADLVIVGAHGEGFIHRFLLGSTASTLLRKSRCPVLVVKAPCREAYRKIMVAIDFSPASALAIRMAAALAPRADLLLLAAFEVPFEPMLQYAGVEEDVLHRYRIEARERTLRQLHDTARNAGLPLARYTPYVPHGDATRQILAQEERSDCDLLVMGKHGTHVTEELLLGSVTKRVLAESRSDVLVVVDKRAPPVGGAPLGSTA